MSRPFSFLITGGSSGLGLNVTLAALRSGHKVIATARNPTKAKQASPEVERLRGSWLTLDVTSQDTESIVKKAVEEHGVNVLVNNAGCALLGAVEDMSDAEMLAQMDTNFFGCLRTIKGALPAFRERKNGTIVNISSGAGIVGRPSRGLYAGSKFALEGASESLSGELAPFNIRVVVVEPGAYSTNMPNALALPAKGTGQPYEGTPADKMVKMTQDMANERLGDPAKAAQRIVEVITGTGMATSEEVQGCLRVPLGSDCMKIAREKWMAFGKNLDAMEEIAASTAFDDWILEKDTCLAKRLVRIR